MARYSFSILFAVLALLAPDHGAAGILDLKAAPFSATGDGTTDDRPALKQALAQAQSGDVILVPEGSYRIALLQQTLVVPPGVAVWSQGGKAKFILTSDGGPNEYREFLRLASGVTLEGLTIERTGDFPAVLLPLAGDLTGVTLRNCRIDGHAARFPQHFCHAIQVGLGTLKDLILQGVEINACTYGLFQSNEATGTVDGVTVDHCRFAHNTASDLEFNAPKGIMHDIVVRDCFFRDNRCQSAAAGFAVGFANVTQGRVENCHIQDYGSEALHIEDRSAEIHLTGNLIVAGSVSRPNGVILVVNNSRKIWIDHNFIDARPNTNRPQLILVTAGGPQFTHPSEVVISDNVLVNGAATKSWYLQPGSGPEPSGNVVFPANTSTRP